MHPSSNYLWAYIFIPKPPSEFFSRHHNYSNNPLLTAPVQPILVKALLSEYPANHRQPISIDSHKTHLPFSINS